MKSKLSALIASQLPLHVRNTSEVFVSFLEAYYEWLEQRNNSLGLINYFPENTDIDRTLDEFLENFLKTYAEFIPKETAYNKRDLVKRLSDLYSAKGSTAAVKFLFRLVYNTDAEVFFPRENILRASDGRWVQKKTIRVRRQTGSIDSITEKEIFWSNSSGFYRAKVEGVEQLDQGVFDLALNITQKVILNESDIVNVVDPSSNQLLFRGIAIKTPDFLSIINGGKYFQIGQIFEIEGSKFSTVFKVTDVDQNGSITGLRILKFGFNYQNDIISNVIPFSNTDLEVNFTLSLSPNGFEAGIKDKVVNFEDQILVDISYGDYNPNSYYAEDYVLSTGYYTAYRAIDLKTSTGKPPSTNTNQGFFNSLNLTEQDLLDSVATIRLNLGTISKYQGKWSTVDGFLNEPSIVIQDSFFYQDFSYVVQSNVTIRKYRDMLLNILHPVGTKFFSQLLLSETLDLSQVIMVDAVRQYLMLLDSQVIPEDIVIKDIVKPTNNEVAAIEGDIIKDIEQEKRESLVPEDEIIKDFSAPKTENLDIIDSPFKEFNVKLTLDSFTANDSEIAGGAQYVVDLADYYADMYYVVNFSDTVYKDIQPNIFDTSTSDDIVPSFSVGINAIDVQMIDDNEESVDAASQFNRTFSHLQPVNDSVSLSFSNIVSESVPVVDSEAVKEINQNNVETQIVQDAESKSFSYSADSSVTTIDETQKELDKQSTSDAATIDTIQEKSISMTQNDMSEAVAGNFNEIYTQGNFFLESYMETSPDNTISMP